MTSDTEYISISIKQLLVKRVWHKKYSLSNPGKIVGSILTATELLHSFWLFNVLRPQSINYPYQNTDINIKILIVALVLVALVLCNRWPHLLHNLPRLVDVTINLSCILEWVWSEIGLGIGCSRKNVINKLQ